MPEQRQVQCACHPPMGDIGAFLDAFRHYPNFAWSKINHGFWEALADVEHHLGWPPAVGRYEHADRIAHRQHFFAGGFVDELLELLASATATADPALTLAFELSAWPDDNRVTGTPSHPDRSEPFLARYTTACTRSADGLLLKRAIADGKFELVLDELRNHPLVVVGPDLLSAWFDVTATSGTHVSIHPSDARRHRAATESEIRRAIEEAPAPPVVLLQAGTLAPYWLLRLRPDYPDVRWIDGGLALSICAPHDLLWRDWGRVYRADIVRLYNRLCPARPLPERARFDAVARLVAAPRPAASDRAVRFVASEPPDHTRVVELLDISAAHNHWANGGPLWNMLGRAYEEYLGIPEIGTVVPCANGGLALEALARLQGVGSDRPLRWAVSSFTFRNQGRGYFSDAVVVDCDQQGMVDLDALARTAADQQVDGVIVTNPFGLWTDFDDYIDFALSAGLALVIDNAAGLGPAIPNWPYQAFSLHHTKPYGFGEGGLALMLADDREAFLELITYRALNEVAAADWVGNGKLSEAACAYHLDRLERAPEWTPRYEMQARRITNLAVRAGLRPLFDWGTVHAATSLPFLAPRPLPVDELANPHLVVGKYYQPLAPTPLATRIYSHIVNIPAHPDVAQVDEADLMDVMRRLVGAQPS